MHDHLFVFICAVATLDVTTGRHGLEMLMQTKQTVIPGIRITAQVTTLYGIINEL
jgi:hypothetical protein